MKRSVRSKRDGISTPVYLVVLRRPRSRIDEKRSDPFWEFGSFGITGCKQRCLLHPHNSEIVHGARLAFVQGGEDGAKLVYLTPPVKAHPFVDRVEVTWKPAKLPFTYAQAPLVVDMEGNSQFSEIKKFIAQVRHHAWTSKFAFKFRTRATPLSTEAAEQMVQIYTIKRRSAERRKQGIAVTYEQALPWDPPVVDRNRKRTYDTLIQEATARV